MRRTTKENMNQLILGLLRESQGHAKANWAITLHPGYRYAETRGWRDPSKENAIIATKGFVRLMNSFLNNGSSRNRYVKGIVAVERSETGHWHSHMIIQQTASDEEVFIKRMMKLDGLVNNPSYIVTDGFKTYFGSRGIGYKNESGCYMQFQKLNEDHDRIAAYSLKSASTQIAVLDGPTLNDDFFTFEPEHVTINKREWKEREQYIAAMKMGAKSDQAKEQARVDRDAEVQDL